MSFFNRLKVFCALAALCTPLHAQTKKGDVFLAEGRLHEAKKEWDAALECFRKAQTEDPLDPVYQVALDKGRLQAAQAHVENGMKVRERGQLAGALAEFQKAYAINPGSVIASQMIQETQQMIARERQRVQETGQEATPEVKALTPGQTAEKDNAGKIGQMLPVPVLRPIKPGTVDVKMTGKTKTIFETLGKFAGIQVLWDPNYIAPAHDAFTVDFHQFTIDQAFDSIALLSKSNWKRLSPNIVFVTNDISPRQLP